MLFRSKSYIPMSAFCLISSLDGFFPPCVCAHEVSHCFNSARMFCDFVSYSVRAVSSMVSARQQPEDDVKGKSIQETAGLAMGLDVGVDNV